MKQSEIEKILEEKFPDNWDKLEVDMQKSRYNENRIEITVARMYSYVDVDFEFLSAMSELLKIKKINFEHGESYGGCETCDYGSRYTVELHVDDIGVDIEWDA